MEHRKEEKGKIKKTLRHIVGWTFIVFGIIGLFLPFLQGILFLIAGISILTPDIPLFHRVMTDLERRHPEIFRRAKEFTHKLASLLRKKTSSRTQDRPTGADDERHG